MGITTLTRLLSYTKQHVNHFLDIFAEQVTHHEASLFLGAGVPINSGYPGWFDLPTPCAGELNLDINLKVDLYSATQFYANKHSDAELRCLMSNRMNRIVDNNMLLEELLDVGFRNIWTTNYDKLIEQGLTARYVPHNTIFATKILLVLISKTKSMCIN